MDIPVPPRITGAGRILERYSEEVAEAIRALRDRRPEPHRPRAERVPFQSFVPKPQGDDTVIIGEGRLHWLEEGDGTGTPKIGLYSQTEQIAESGAITVTDGQIIYLDTVWTVDGRNIAQTGSSDLVKYWLLTYSSSAYVARAALTPAGIDLNTIGSTFKIAFAIAKFDVAGGVASVNTEYRREDIEMGLAAWAEFTPAS